MTLWATRLSQIPDTRFYQILVHIAAYICLYQNWNYFDPPARVPVDPELLQFSDTVEINDHVVPLRFVTGQALAHHCDSTLDEVYGCCGDPSDKADMGIYVDASLTGVQKMEVLIHEFLHCSDHKTLSEEYVTDTAEDIARELAKLGFGEL